MVTVRKLLLELLALVLHLLRQTLTQNNHIRALAVDLFQARIELHVAAGECGWEIIQSGTFPSE